uniref:Uncharacterized protein n=1 Tax=viral metagenome TaxID=1070528 RepID=A0A6C0I0V6_9ZZZZ
MPRSLTTSKPKPSTNTYRQKKWASEIARMLTRKTILKAKSEELAKKTKSKSRKIRSLSPNWKPKLQEYIPRFRHILSEDQIQEILKNKESYDPETADKILKEIDGEYITGSLSLSPDSERKSNELLKVNKIKKKDKIKKENRTKEYLGKTKNELKHDLKIWTCLLKIYGFENIPKSLTDIFHDKNDLFKELRIQTEIQNIMNENLSFKNCLTSLHF